MGYLAAEYFLDRALIIISYGGYCSDTFTPIYLQHNRQHDSLFPAAQVLTAVEVIYTILSTRASAHNLSALAGPAKHESLKSATLAAMLLSELIKPDADGIDTFKLYWQHAKEEADYLLSVLPDLTRKGCLEVYT